MSFLPCVILIFNLCVLTLFLDFSSINCGQKGHADKILLNTDTRISDTLSRFSSLIKDGRKDKEDHRSREEGKGS
jgi:hypothetical protein